MDLCVRGSLKKGDEREDSCPTATIRGAPGARVLIARQKTRITFEVKLTPMGIVMSLPAEQIFTGFTCY